jgi:hypothetical protein
MTIAELRKALEGLPDDMLVVHSDESWLRIADKAAPQEVLKRGEFDIGDFVETWFGTGTGEPQTVFVIS